MQNFSNTTNGWASLGAERAEGTAKCNEILDLIFSIINGIIALIILAGNSLTCVIFLSTKHLRQQYMNVFLVSLAISDILMAVMVVPGYAAFCTECNYLTMDSCWILAQTKDVVFSSTFFSLLAITYDRYLAVLRPLRYNSKMTRRKVICMLVAIWVTPAIVAAARNIWWLTQADEKAREINQVYNVILVFTLVFLPAFVMALVNALIVRAIQTQNRKILPPARNLEVDHKNNDIFLKETRSENARKRKGTTACATVVLVFVLSWIPRSVYNFGFVFGNGDLVTPLLVKLSMLFLLLQSCANPFIYSFYRADFRQAARQLLSRFYRSG
ncbi:adenosine receptor A2a-like [Montipora foliosa]|uniref:adenosine receptor A2a-like n=1 Tax=Montipora foliosa TaxID=591990 RepID=UPI0035F1C4DA